MASQRGFCRETPTCRQRGRCSGGNQRIRLFGRRAGALRAEPFFAVDFVKLGFGPVLLFVAWSLWRLKRWAWIWALLVVGVDMLVSMYTLFSVPREIGPLITLTAWIDLSLALIVVYLLSRPDVQATYGHRVRR